MTMKSKKFFISSHAFSSGGSTVNINKNAVFDHPIMFKQKMVRHRRKSGVRKTMECFRRCLNNKAFSHVLKWKDKHEKIFSVLFKHRKSPQWSSNYLALFQELDKNSKSEKYVNQKDAEKTGKQRCRANLKKLCEDGLLECVGEKKFDKCTREVYYKIIDNGNDQTNFHTDNEWIDNSYSFPYGDVDNSNNHFSNMALQPIYGNNGADNIHLSDTSNTSAGNDEYNEESEASNKDNYFTPMPQLSNSTKSNFSTDVYYEDEFGNCYQLLATSEDVTIDSNDFSKNMDLMPAFEESSDLNDLFGDKVTEISNNDMWSMGFISNFEPAMDLNEVANIL